MALPDLFGGGGARVWAIVIAVIAAVLLLGCGYDWLEKILIILVSSFTLLTVFCTMTLQHTAFAITFTDIRQDLLLRLPDPMTAAVAMTAQPHCLMNANRSSVTS